MAPSAQRHSLACFPRGLRPISALFACALGAAACSGPPELTSPWPRQVLAERMVEQGTLRICADLREVLPLSGPPPGLCLAPEAEPPSCEDDANCGAVERCICGRCLAPVCAGDADCAPGQRCGEDWSCRPVCGGDADCPALRPRCEGGLCRRTCADVGACGEGQTCDLGRGTCRLLPCHSGEESCPGLSTCRLTRQALDLAEPDVHPPTADAPWRMWVEVRTPEGRAYVAHGSSLDGWQWELEMASELPRAVLAPTRAWEGERVGAPSVVRLEPERWLMAYAGGAGVGRGIGVATSTDGSSWVSSHQPALAPALAWEGDVVGSPSLLAGPSELRLYYEAGFGIGLAVVDSDTTVRRVADPQGRRLPAWTAAQAELPWRWPRLAAVRSPATLRLPPEAGPPRVYFEARPAPAAPGPDDDGGEPTTAMQPGVGFAAAFDGESLRSFPFNPALQPRLPAVTGAGEPAACLVGDRAELFFVRLRRPDALTAPARGGLARAIASDALTGPDLWR